MTGPMHSMSPEKWARVERILDELLEIEPAKRAARLDEMREVDEDVRRHVARLLAADRRSPDLLAASPEALLAGVLDRESAGPLDGGHAEAAGRNVGPYRLLRELGRGGMGDVYLAERDDLGKRVALKLARGARYSPETKRRFEREQRLLSRLAHPGIAQLHDAGVTDDGTPYFAMELVEGDTIVQYAGERELYQTERLELFLDVCAAVQFAHRNLVVHRDIKPSNVLVDRSGDVKLLDFGIAKLIEESDQGGLTRTGTRVFTPGYAAPEQLRGEAVTTATDVYQLGGLLYALLSGHAPFDVSTLSPYEAERLVLETDPPPPSRVASTRTTARLDGADVADRSGARALRVHGDLDAIALKALRKAPEDRYPSVEALAEDVRRYLTGRPVGARAGGWTYRARKFVRRHRVATAFSALATGFVVTALVQARTIAQERDRAEREAQTADRVADFMVGLFEDASPGEGPVDAVELVEAGAARLDLDLSDEPEVRASFQEALGRVLNALGRYDGAERLLEASAQARSELFGPDAAETASAMHYLGEIAYGQGEYERSDSLARRALAIRERVFGRASPEVMETLWDLAGVAYATGRYAEAEELAREAVELGASLYPNGDAQTGSAMNTLANAVWAQGRREEGQQLMRRAADIRRAVFPGDHPELAITLNNLAFMTWWRGGSLDEAREAAEQALGMQQRLFPEGHPDIAYTTDNLAEIALRLGDTSRARDLAQSALALRERLLGPDHADVAQSHELLGLLAAETGSYGESEGHYREAIRITAAASSPENPRIPQYRAQIGRVLLRAGRPDEGLRLLEEAYRAGQRVLGSDHPTVVSWGRELADELRAGGRLSMAREIEAELPADSAASGPVGS